MPKQTDVQTLAHQMVERATASAENWESFLHTAAFHSTYTFGNQLLIWGQRPQAVSCATMQYWNEKTGRWVRRGSHGIALMDTSGTRRFQLVFDLQDTYVRQDKPGAMPWFVTEQNRQAVLDTLCAEQTEKNPFAVLEKESAELFSQQQAHIFSAMKERCAESSLEWFAPEEQQDIVLRLVQQSAQYMAAVRLGLDARKLDSSSFAAIQNFDTQRAGIFLGNAVRMVAKPLLAQIGAIVRQADSVAKAQPARHNKVVNEHQTQEQEVAHGVQERERVSGPEPALGSSRPAAAGQVRQSAPDLSGGERPDDLRRDAAGRDTARPSAGGADRGGAANHRDDAAAAAAQSRPGQDYRPAGLDTIQKQPADAGRGAGDAAGVQPVTEEANPLIEAESAQTPSAFLLPALTPQQIETVLCHDGLSRVPNEKVLAFFHAEAADVARADFLRDAYDGSYAKFTAENVTLSYHKEANGLRLRAGTFLNPTAESFLSWQTAAQLVADYVDSGHLLAPVRPMPEKQTGGQLSFLDAEEPVQELAEMEPPSFSEEEIQHALRAGSGFAGGTERIGQRFRQQHSEKENAEWLKKEYGIGGRSWTFLDGEHGWLSYDAKGIELRSGPNDHQRKRILKWNEVTQRIQLMVQMEQYLTAESAQSVQPQLEQLDQAKQLVGAFCAQEYGQSDPEDYADLHHVPLAYTDAENGAHALEIEADLLQPAIRYLADGETIHEDSYETLSELIDTELSSLEYDRMVADLDAYAEQYLSEKEFRESSDAQFAKAHLVPGETTFQWEGRTFLVDKVNAETVDLQDVTFAQNTGFPIFRMESLAAVRRQIQQQENPFVMRVLQDVQQAAVPYQEVPINYEAPYQPPVPASAKEKFAANIQAIQLLKIIEQRTAAGGSPANAEEQKTLAAYCGWGGLADVFDPKKSSWSAEYAQLKDLLTNAEYDAARSSTLTAFYTPSEVIHPMYRALERMGVTGGNILDPAMGVGAFFGHKPTSFDQNDAQLYGVELDDLTGRIAKQLYQKAHIQVTGYEKASLPDSFFDAAIGNVPFGDFSVSDRQYDKLNFRIHDYFLAKTIDKLRAGGIMAFITSSGTMDKKDERVRKYLAARCTLIGAVRLPNSTFKRNAGTEVTSDVLFFQKRDRLSEREEPWLHLAENEDGILVNRYFADHPEMVCGHLEMVSGPYGLTMTCQPDGTKPLEQQLDAAMSHLEATLPRAEILLEEGEQAGNTIPADTSVRNFSYTLVEDKIYYRENSLMREVHPNKTAEQRVRALIGLRDTCRDLLQAQLDDRPDAVITDLQKQLNDQYDSYQKKHGLINSRAASMAFGEDSSYFLLCSLENIDDDGNFKNKTDLFYKRTIRSAQPVTHADTASDALALSIGEKACVDLNYMHQLTGKTEAQLVEDLQGVIFRQPEETNFTGKSVYLPADEYLSGNVREKLAQARKAAADDPAFRVNVKALEQVQPKDLDASEIVVRVGATWIPTEVYQQFMVEMIQPPYFVRDRIAVHYAPYTCSWNISNKNMVGDNVAATATYGTGRANFYRIFEESLNLRAIRIFDTVEELDGSKKQVLNLHETQAAQAKQQQIEEAFAQWVFKDIDRRQKLVQLYNTKFNAIRPREFSGEHILFRGMNPEITLRPHQRNAIAHILYGGNTLLAHVVGAGKTFEMVAAAMEKKRLGLCSKTMIAVPNHLTEQLASEALLLYPNAKLLVATRKDFEKSRRKRFCSKIATGEYDIIVIGHSQFQKIPLSQQRQEQYLRDEIQALVQQAAQLRRERAENFTVKQVERLKKQLEKRLDKLVNTVQRDDVVSFEELGVDNLMVDEAHNFKNLMCPTKMRNVAGINQTESQKASDLLMKCTYLDEVTGGRGVTFATGTPISNSMTEMYTMMRYLQYHTLEKNGIASFDSWASTFGETVTAIELAPEGTGYRTKTRFAKFYNLPELMSLFKQCADVQTADMLHLPVPELEGGKPVDVALEPSQIQKDMIEELSERAEGVRSGNVDPSVDNMLRITNDGRKLALDQRLMDPSLPDDPNSKANACVERVFDIWQKTAAQSSTQMIFCDLSTPKPGTFNVYDDIQDKLMARGIPKEEIQFIHHADTETKKAELFGKVRSGKVRVLMGSTAKMGAGTNVQHKLIALHHLDVPWRPSDIEQREGRMVRQGNENPKVQIFRYVTKGTFDAYSWQLIENKQRFISQIMTSKSPARSCDDMDDAALSYAEIKALAAGNPYIKEKMDLDIQVSRLRNLKASYTSQHYKLEDALAIGYPAKQQALRNRITMTQQDVKTVRKNTVLDETGKEAFAIQLDGKRYDKREEAGRALLGMLGAAVKSEEPVAVGQYRGFAVRISYDPFQKLFYSQLAGAGCYQTQLGTDALGNMSRLSHLLNGLEEKIPGYEAQLADISTQMDSARKELQNSFPQEQELTEKSQRLAELNALLNMNEKESAMDIDLEQDISAAPAKETKARDER